MRPNRLCYCPQCSTTAAGYKSVAYVTWSRHNPPGSSYLPPQPSHQSNPASPVQSMLPQIPPSVDFEVGIDDSQPNPLPLLHDRESPPQAPPPVQYNDELEAGHDWMELADNDDDGDSAYNDDYPPHPSMSPAPEPYNQPVPDDIPWPFPPGDPIAQHYSLEPDPDHPTGQSVRIDIENLQKHHHLPEHLRQIYTAIAYGKATGLPNVPANVILQQMTSLAEVCLNEEIDEKTYNVRTAQSRLGVLPDDYISQWIVCPNNNCWLMLAISELYQLESPACVDCGTDLYRLNNDIRRPIKVMPTMSLSISLALLLQDRDVIENLQTWREARPNHDIVEPHRAMATDKDAPFLHPTEPMSNISDGSAWRYARVAETRRVGEDDRVYDEVPYDEDYRHVGQHHGLQIILNCDWFAVKGVIGSSVGVVYASIANLPITMRYKKRYTAVLGVIPGPKEPPGLLFNKAIEPIVRDLQLCERGFRIDLPTCPNAYITARLLLISCDLPAARKMTGSMGLSHKAHPCPHCGITLDQVNSLEGYTWRSLPKKPGTAATSLQAGFEYERATPGRRFEIEQEYGIRFSALSRLCGFEPSDSAPTDPLHNSFLGLVKSFMNMLLKSDLFEGSIEGEARIDVFKSFFEEADYPGHLGRLPTYAIGQLVRQSVGERTHIGSGLKADQWRRVIEMLPIALYVAWRDEGTNTISDSTLDPEEDLEEVPVRGRQKGSRGRGRRKSIGRDSNRRSSSRGRRQRSVSVAGSTSSCGSRKSMRSDGDDAEAADPTGKEDSSGALILNRSRWYQAALALSAGLRLLHSHNISVDDAEAAVEDIANAARTVLSLNGHLTINWHIAMHYARFIQLYGPVAGFGCWAFERHNGDLSNVKHNGKVDMPTTLLRAWVREARLAAIINNPAPNAGVAELLSLEALRQFKLALQGTLMLQEARGQASRFKLPNPFQPNQIVDLGRKGIYLPLLQYMQRNLPEYQFRDEANLDDDGPSLPKWGSCYRLYTHVFCHGYKFGSCLYGRSQRDRHALVITDQQTGVSHLGRIQLYLHIVLSLRHTTEKLVQVLALVDFFEPQESSEFPWQHREIDLGVRIYKNKVTTRAFVPVTNLRAATTDGHEPEFEAD
ncbi:hypothetical protein HD553DRAFT_343093 [Filobasidium floriforme]|uniref:uncharacterized protein n=1 Tax=Filobasidium floriforme TaxID=5210 RepID=UPI001E8EE1ED|nr:uncharacterized protein HD553DRAFT_343093 [Filobasidium floriforme]KAH8083100.1 hypothetical protein HD553DRAFT_343093 [Filobasidium floriforme]